jgi:malate dehydrogenase (oxaloacetate-decarboxylating)(NADP+)
MREAVDIVRRLNPDLAIDGEMQADIAVSPEILAESFPFSTLQGGANILIFPSLSASTSAYKLVQRLGNAEAVGPILLGMDKPVAVLQYGGFNEIDVVNATAVAVVDAQEAAH